jgi:hypothetical protein
MKVCRECKTEKPLSDFYKHPQMADGHLNKCAECVKSRVTKHREANLEKIQAYDKMRSKQPHRLQAIKDYAKTEAGKLTKKKAMSAYHARYPMKRAAHVITGNAVRSGKLIPESSCSICNSTEKIEGHHDDYTKPLDVRWLCEKCHKQWHRENKPIYE